MTDKIEYKNMCLMGYTPYPFISIFKNKQFKLYLIIWDMNLRPGL